MRLLPSITDFAKLLETATNPDSDATARDMAAAYLVVAYAKAERRATMGDVDLPAERTYVGLALSIARSIRDDARRSDRAAEDAALEHAIKVDEEDKRVKHEASVPWGEEQR